MPTVTSPLRSRTPPNGLFGGVLDCSVSLPANPLIRSRPGADNPGIKPGTMIPAGLSGNQLTAYLEGYAAAAACSEPRGAPRHAGSLRSDLCVSFLRGFEDGVASEHAKDARATSPAVRHSAFPLLRWAGR